MHFDFHNKTVFITGANGEIGRATAKVFSAGLAKLALTDVDKKGVLEFAKSLDTEVLALKQDVTSAGETKEAVSRTVARFGNIDILVTASGLYDHLPLSSIGVDAWRRSVAINLDGVFLTIRAVLPHLSEGGCIVNLASMAGHRGSADHAAYAAAKGGVLALTRSLAQELAPRIRVNAVSPGLIETRMMQSLAPARKTALIDATPLGRLGRVEEIAGAIAFLSSDTASFVTGETLHVNGGLYMAG